MNTSTTASYPNSLDNSKSNHSFANFTRTTVRLGGYEIQFGLYNPEFRNKSGAVEIKQRITLTPAAAQRLLEKLRIAVDGYQGSIGPPSRPEPSRIGLPPDAAARIRMLTEMQQRAV